MTLELEDGSVKVLKTGDIVVQRGTSVDSSDNPQLQLYVLESHILLRWFGLSDWNHTQASSVAQQVRPVGQDVLRLLRCRGTYDSQWSRTQDRVSGPKHASVMRRSIPRGRSIRD